MRFSKNSLFHVYYTPHLFFRRFVAHYRSCKIAIFTRRIYFSTGLFAFICLTFIFTDTVELDTEYEKLFQDELCNEVTTPVHKIVN